MTILDYVVNLSLSIVLIVGAYQFYFWCQRHHRSPRLFHFSLDYRVRRRPEWVWIYSGLYYPAIILTAATAKNMRLFNYTAFSYLLLLLLQMTFFLFFPVVVPEEWRMAEDPRTMSERFLELIQRYDARSNCFPSMHVSVATLTAFHLRANSALGNWSFCFPILIAISAVCTKQHYFVDIPAGIALGWLCYRLLQIIYL
jgi:membrane-associated phospholipid phosphatase